MHRSISRRTFKLAGAGEDKESRKNALLSEHYGESGDEWSLAHGRINLTTAILRC